jgi:hypothetical protein
MRGTPSLRYSPSETSRGTSKEARLESNSGQAELTIGQMAQLFAVSLRTLRFYEQLGIITPRREGHARFYRAADRTRMEMILRAKTLGFTLKEINNLIGGGSEAAR